MGEAAVGKEERGGAPEALRFLAAAFIVLYHFGADAPVELATLSPVLARGWLATDFFLILSGFVLGRAYGRSLDEGRTDPAAFVGRRLLRVWPAHLVVLAGFVILVKGAHLLGVEPAHPEHYRMGDLAAQAGLSHAWGLTHNADWNVPSWSLSALAVCYLAFPGAWAATRGMGPRTAVGLALLIVAIAAAAARTLLDRSLYDLPFDMGVLRALPLFLGGLLLSRVCARLALKPAMAGGLGTAALAAVASLAAAPRGDLADFAAICALGLLIVAADAWKGGRSRLTAWGARISFALFITHALTGAVWYGSERWALSHLGLSATAQWTWWALGLPAALLAAWAFERVVDAPLQRALKGLRWRPGRCPAPAPSG